MRRLAAIASGASLIALAACSSSNDAPSGGSTCTPDPTVLATARDCRSDDQCPCGAHCSLGACSSDCGVGASSKSCSAGARCDSFGRCRAPGDDAPIRRSRQGHRAVSRSKPRTSRFLPEDRRSSLSSGESRARTDAHRRQPRLRAAMRAQRTLADRVCGRRTEGGHGARGERAGRSESSRIPGKSAMRKSPLAVAGGKSPSMAWARSAFSAADT